VGDDNLGRGACAARLGDQVSDASGRWVEKYRVGDLIIRTDSLCVVVRPGRRGTGGITNDTILNVCYGWWYSRDYGKVEIGNYLCRGEDFVR
jgi:hypothetical protein